MAEILMRRTSLPVKLQHDAGKFGRIIIFKRSCNILRFNYDLVQQFKRLDKGQHQLRQDFDVENMFVKLQHDACNSGGVIVFTRQPDRQFMKSYRVHMVRTRLKVQKGHKKFIIEIYQNSDMGEHSV